MLILVSRLMQRRGLSSDIYVVSPLGHALGSERGKDGDDVRGQAKRRSLPLDVLKAYTQRDFRAIAFDMLSSYAFHTVCQGYSGADDTATHFYCTIAQGAPLEPIRTTGALRFALFISVR